MTGAGDRVRGWVKTEMDVVVSAKEAEQARQQLIKERKTLAEEMQKLKVESRRTMNSQEMEETSSKQTDLQEQLDMRNLQISELQKEIMLAEQDKEKSGDRWAKMTSMTDSKIAVSFLFNSATEAMATATTRAREVIAIGSFTILSSFLNYFNIFRCASSSLNWRSCWPTWAPRRRS